jgi:hypothetical protein
MRETTSIGSCPEHSPIYTSIKLFKHIWIIRKQWFGYLWMNIKTIADIIFWVLPGTVNFRQSLAHKETDACMIGCQE